MSRGFVREDDQEEAPFIPPRAALPAGVTNYVTPEGYALLVEERESLESRLRDLDIRDDKERRHATAVLSGKLGLLNQRISSARILDPRNQPGEVVRFGAWVDLKNLSDQSVQTFQIVGVDQADVKKQKISFIAPIARAVTGKTAGELVELNLGGELRRLEILRISYNQGRHGV